jgi:hypothetical protein
MLKYLFFALLVACPVFADEVTFGEVVVEKALVYHDLDHKDFQPQNLMAELPKGTKVLVACRLISQTKPPKKSLSIVAFTLDGKTVLSGYMDTLNLKEVQFPLKDMPPLSRGPDNK